MRKYILDMIIERKFRIRKFAYISNKVGTAYMRLTKFIVVDVYVGFP
jgi:hypothetical protein